MLNSLLESTPIPVLAKVAAFAERRQDVLAGNLANISTTDYRTRDLPVARFQEALRQAIAGRQGGAGSGGVSQASSAAAEPATLEELFPRDLFRASEAEPASLTFLDGNNRSIEAEVVQLSKNSLMQNYALELMLAQMRMLETVISERV